MYNETIESDYPKNVEVKHQPTFTSRIEELYKLAEVLNGKVRPFSFPENQGLNPASNPEVEKTELIYALDGVIDRFNSIISRIEG